MSETTQEGRDRLATDSVVGVAVALRRLATDADGGADGAAKGAARAEDAAGAAGDAVMIDQLRALEELKSAAAAVQARVTARFAAAQRDAQRAAGVPAKDVGKGIAAQVGLARRDSPSRGSRHLGLAEALVHEMPHTLAALAAGHISEWRAILVVRETACLSVEDRGRVDAELAGRPGGLEALGDRATAVEARRIGYRLDPHAAVRRARRAESERRVGLRPAPDTMSWLGALLPAKQGVAAYAALGRAADAARAAGDVRSRGQVIADTLVERLTGQTIADHVPVEVNLHITDAGLFGDDPEPADLEGYGPVPAPLARDWLRGEDRADRVDPPAAQARVWLRRLYRRPETGELVAMDSRHRLFTGTLRRFLVARDQVCRTPWCDAPIRHADHPVPAAKHGQTTARNGQGLCEACNYAKQATGWTTRVVADGTDAGTVQTTTPTGHRYTSRPPPGIGRPPPTDLDLAS